MTKMQFILEVENNSKMPEDMAAEMLQECITDAYQDDEPPLFDNVKVIKPSVIADVDDPVTKRKLISQSAQYWYDWAHRADENHSMAQRLLFMENALNHTEGVLAYTLRALGMENPLFVPNIMVVDELIAKVKS